ncbi:hypothetical protein KJ809_03775, partial [Patescibacteria group bacterium]|nr:hypothetical protein [Patescibacteria group bacterium]
MLKKIQFKLVRIKYTGKSIGDDIRVDVEILGNTISVDEKIIINKTVEINKEIGSFFSDQKSLATEVKITVVEKDVLFNDVGNIKESIKIDANISNPQKFAFTIELQENRFWKNWGKSVAKFEVTLEALVVESIKYIPDVSNGWLKVNLVDGESISLPAYLKVQSEYFERNREYFTILEGYYKNKKASVSL